MLTHSEIVIEYLQGNSPKQRGFKMYNFDYIPIDQEVIDQAVEQSKKRRKEARALLRNACKDAGGNYDIIVFRNDRRRIARALDELKIFWCEIDKEILVSRHELYDAVLPKE